MRMRIKVKVKPNAGVVGVEKVPAELFSEEGIDGLYYVKLKEEPEGGAANLELMKVLKEYFNAKEIKILQGYTKRVKVVEIVE